MKCFYHSADLDGHCSGAIVKYAHEDCEMYPIDYGFEDKFPWDKIERGETVYMVDFGLQPFELMLKLNEKANLIWIDHHKSAIDEMEKWVGFGQEKAILGFRRIGIGACALTWEYLWYTSVPYPVKLLAMYDVWNHFDPKTLPFQYGMRLRKTDPADSKAMDLWVQLFEGPSSLVDEIVREGTICLNYQEQLNARLCKEVFEVEFERMKCLAINGRGNSQVFEPIWNPEKYDAMILFYMRADRKWLVSLYTTKDEVDVSEVAKKYGGGGHKQAAGFVCNSLPF